MKEDQNQPNEKYSTKWLVSSLIVTFTIGLVVGNRIGNAVPLDKFKSPVVAYISDSPPDASTKINKLNQMRLN
jgi:hypothetical protein